MIDVDEAYSTVHTHLGEIIDAYYALKKETDALVVENTSLRIHTQLHSSTVSDLVTRQHDIHGVLNDITTIIDDASSTLRGEIDDFYMQCKRQLTLSANPQGNSRDEILPSEVERNGTSQADEEVEELRDKVDALRSYNLMVTEILATLRYTQHLQAGQKERMEELAPAVRVILRQSGDVFHADVLDTLLRDLHAEREFATVEEMKAVLSDTTEALVSTQDALDALEKEHTLLLSNAVYMHNELGSTSSMQATNPALLTPTFSSPSVPSPGQPIAVPWRTVRKEVITLLNTTSFALGISSADVESLGLLDLFAMLMEHLQELQRRRMPSSSRRMKA